MRQNQQGIWRNWSGTLITLAGSQHQGTTLILVKVTEERKELQKHSVVGILIPKIAFKAILSRKYCCLGHLLLQSYQYEVY